MTLFGKKENEFEEEDGPEEKEKAPRRIKRIRKKEEYKPWGKFERYFVLVMFLSTVGIAGVLSASARAWKLPNLPKLSIPKISDTFLFKEGTVVIENQGSKTNQQKINKIKKDFESLTDSHSGIYAFYVYDLEGNYFYGSYYQEKMQAASLIKLPVMALAYKKIEQGELKIEDYEDELVAMGKRSDNQAFLKVKSDLGENIIQKYINEIGMTQTSLSENITTAEDIGLFFNKLYKNELIKSENTQKLLESLTETIFEDWIAGGLPKDIKVAHKYGREVHVVNDAGIVYSSKPLVIVIMTDGVIEKEADELFPRLTKLLYDEHTNENTY